MKTTIKDISNYTGLSITTVSLVLNNKPSKIPEKTKRRVIEAAKKLNYSPNLLAVGLVTKRTQTLGLIVTDISNNFYGILAKGVETACQEDGWTVILCNSWNSQHREEELLQLLINKSVDGIIYCMSDIASQAKAKKDFNLLRTSKVPFIVIDNDFGELSKHNIFFDNKMGGYLATKYLLDNGHKRIACITGSIGIGLGKGRIEGYKKALEEAGIPIDSTIMVNGDYTMESGYRAMKSLKGKDFTAVFSFNDMMAFGAFKALKNMGISVPNDISLVGYDDVPFCEILEVPLTTVRQPVYEMGYSAAKSMIEIILTESKESLNMIFPPELMVRKSVKNICKEGA